LTDATSKVGIPAACAPSNRPANATVPRSPDTRSQAEIDRQFRHDGRRSDVAPAMSTI